jgi:hypothetical protein
MGRVLPPSRRHYADRVKESTLRKESNRLFSPGADVSGDVEAIRSGQAPYQETQLADGQFTLPNGRVYGVERLPDGRRMLYPLSGPGVEALSRAQLRALGAYNRLGNTPRAATTLERKLQVDPEDREAALQLSGGVGRSQP